MHPCGPRPTEHASLAARCVTGADPLHYHLKVRHISHWHGGHLAFLGTLAPGRSDACVKTAGGGGVGVRAPLQGLQRGGEETHAALTGRRKHWWRKQAPTLNVDGGHVLAVSSVPLLTPPPSKSPGDVRCTFADVFTEQLRRRTRAMQVNAPPHPLGRRTWRSLSVKLPFM